MMRTSVFAGLLVLGAAQPLHAQSSPAPGPPIPPAARVPPPPAYVAPPYAVVPPPYVAPPPYPGPTPLQVDMLEASGRHKKRVGTVLMITGGTLMAVGTGLTIAGLWDDHCFSRAHASYYGYSAGGYYGGCSDEALTIGGAMTTVVGVGALVPGIFLHVSGANDVDEARRLRQ